MRIFATLAGAMLAGIMALPASAGPARIFPYDSAVNYCPSGLRPVVFNGVISCGQPNTKISYQQVKRHPSQRARNWRGLSCPEGEKGCY